jgi:iron complex outermembrane receptor protein
MVQNRAAVAQITLVEAFPAGHLAAQNTQRETPPALSDPEVQTEADPEGTEADDTEPEADSPATADLPPAGQGNEGLIAQPSTLAAPPPAPMSSLLSQLSAMTPERSAELGGGVSANIVSGAEVSVLGTTDAGDLLTSSIFNTGVYSRQISPVITNTRVRGYRYKQVAATLNGAPWFPVRPDADTPLSRFDSNIIEDVAIIRGPYNVRLGPGFSFIDVSMRETPRFANGFHCEDETKFAWDTNGEQWFGRQSFQAGSEHSGWRVGYGHRGGSNYRAGDDLPLASSFNARDIDVAYGVDLTQNSSVELSYLYSLMKDVDTPGQVNDFEELSSHGVSFRLNIEDQCYFDLLTTQVWFNISNFEGTVNNKRFEPSDPDFFFTPPPGFDFRFARVNSSGETSSLGTRSKMSWGDPSDSIFTLGYDFTMQRQTYLEVRVDTGLAEFGVPKGRQYDTGLFADGQSVVSDGLTLSAGGRVDFVQSNATPTPETDGRSLALNPDVGLYQTYFLGAGYLSAEYDVNEYVTCSAGVGYAERAPSLTDLYGDLPHLSIMQEGAFFLPHGELLLKKEKALQADIGTTWQCDSWRGGLSGFISNVDDFITYQAPHLLFGPHLEHAIGVNNDVRMAGGEFYNELDLSDAWTAFGTLSYVQAKDRDRDEPLWGVPPLDTRMGLRLVDTCRKKKWGVEYTFRLVDEQNRISTVGFTGEVRTPSFNTHSLHGYYKITDKVSFISGAENIGDTFYREHLDTRLDLTLGADPARGIVRRGRSIYLAMFAAY